MSLDSTPQDEMEARLTALLLGELSATEEAVVREAIAKDPALAQLHARLQQTIGLVSEAARSASEDVGTPAATLRLSEKRREKMLRSFKVIKPQPSFWSRWQNVSMRDVSSVAAMLVVLGVLAWMLMLAPALEHYKMVETVGEPDSGRKDEALGAIRAAVSEYSERQVTLARREDRAAALAEQALALPTEGRSQVSGQAPSASTVTELIMDGKSADDAKRRAVKGGRGREVLVAENNYTLPAGGAPSENAGLAGAADGSSFAYGLNQTVSRAASGPQPAKPSPAPSVDVARRSDRKVVLPAVSELSDEMADSRSTLNLWAENRPQSVLAGAVSDPQSARGMSTGAITPARPAVMFNSSTFTTLNPQPQTEFGSSAQPFSGAFASTSGGMGGGGGAGGRAWFGQTRAQPNNPTWAFSASVDKGAPVVAATDRLTVDFNTPAAPTAIDTFQDRLHVNGRDGRYDDVAAKEAKDRFGNEKADVYAGAKLNDVSGAVAATGTMLLPTPAPAVPIPSKPQAVRLGGASGPASVEKEALQLRDMDGSDFAVDSLATAKNPETQTLAKRNVALAIDAPVENFGRVSGVEASKSLSDKKKEVAVVEDEVKRLPALQTADGGVANRELGRFKAINALGIQSGEKPLNEGLVQSGKFLLENGKLDEAEVQLRQAIKLNPNNNAAHHYLTLAQDKRNRNAITRRADSNNERLVGVEEAWNPPIEPDSPQPDVSTGSGIDHLTIVSPRFITGKDSGIVSGFAGVEAKPALQTSDSRFYRSRILLPEQREGDRLAKREPQTQTGPVSSSEVELRVRQAQVEKLADVTYDSLPLAGVISALTKKKAEDDSIRRPAPTAPIPQPEVVTAENAFSTFSLNVSDVSFKLAGAALEKGQMPDPSTVRSEEFINAFDYRDPEPMGSAPIAFAWERARYPFAHDRDLLRFSVKTAASGRQPGRPLNLVLLLDNSGSMERADRIRIREECLRVLASQLQPQDRVSVVAFARTARLWVDGLPGNQAGELPQRVGSLTPEGGTNLEDAMNLAYQTALRHFLANGVNRVVLLTDGAANLGDVEPDSLKKKVEANRKQGIALDCFGIGWDGLNDELLEALSRNGDGRYGFVNTPEAATTEFAGQLAGALKVAASDVKVQVEWNPRRVTAYRQIGYAKHQLKKEQFRDNTVDAAEIGAAEAGNALYTVQVNPAGEGPLGTMRVRFKVPGTSDYREHEWPLPYEGAAKSLDQSSATLRLAASASAFSEWLVSSPFAAEVTPDKLLGYLGNVPEAFSADPRPKKLEWMIRQARNVSGK